MLPSFEHIASPDLYFLSKEVRKEHAIISSRLYNLEMKFKTIMSTLDVLRPFTAQQIAYDADDKALLLAFPGVKSRPFCIMTFSDLVTFINNPTNDCVSGPDAPAAWAALDADQKKSITDKAYYLNRNFMYLRSSIRTLKDCYDTNLTGAVTSYKAAIKSFWDDVEIVNSLACVHHFLYSNAATRIIDQMCEHGPGVNPEDIDYSEYVW